MIPQAVLKRYRVLDRLGEGATADVFRVEDVLHPQRELALKLLDLSKDDRLVPRRVKLLTREFELLSTLNHPNLASVYDFGFASDGQCYFFTSDFVNGPTILDLFEGQPFSLTDRFRVIVELCRVLQYVHSRGFIHNDIKPENILVQRGTDESGDRVKLLDFGFARSSEDNDSLSGTLLYMAPELFKNQRPTPMSDLYAVGVILYRLLTGKLPFSGGSMRELIAAHLHKPWVAPSEHDSALPAPVDQLVARMLAKDPDARFAQAAEVIVAINRLFETRFPIETAETVSGYLQTHRFVARDESFGLLCEAHHSLMSSEGSPGANNVLLYAINGETGVGKTRMLNEFKRHLQLTEQTLFDTVCSDDPTPWRAVRQLQEWIRARHSERLSGSLAGIDALFGEGPRTGFAPADTASRGERLVDALTRLIFDASRLEPLTILIDDAQLLDTASARVLNLLLHNLRYLGQSASGGVRLMLVVAWQDGVPGPLTDTISAYLPTFEVLGLQRFTGDDVRHLLEGTFPGRPIPQSFVDYTFRTSGGNPLFVEELLRDLYEDGVLTLAGDQLISSTFDFTRLERPANLLESVQRRIAKVSELGQSVLRLLSSLSRPIDLSGLLTVAGIEEQEGGRALADLVARGIVEKATIAALRRAGEQPYCQLETEETAFGYRLANLTFRTTVREQLELDPEQVRRTIQWLNGLCDSGAWEQERLAHELAMLQRSLGEMEHAVVSVLQAAAFFMRGYAFGEAAELVQQFVADGEMISTERRADLYLLLAECDFRTGDLDGALANYRSAEQIGADRPLFLGRILIQRGDVDQAIDVLTRRLDQENDLHYAELCGVLIQGLQQKGESEQALERAAKAFAVIDRTISLLEEQHPDFRRGLGIRGEIEIYLGRLHYYRGDYQRAIDTYRRALDRFQVIGDEETTVYLFNSIGIVYHQQGDLEQAISFYQKNLEVARRIGHRIRMSVTYMNLGVAHHNQSDYGRALDYYRQSLEIARELNAKPQIVQAGANMALLHSILGELETARELCSESLSSAGELQNRYMMALVHLTLFDIAMTELTIAEAAKHIEQALELFEELKSTTDVLRVRLHMVEMQLRFKNYQPAREQLEGLLPTLREGDFKAVLAPACLRASELERECSDGDLHRALNFAREAEGLYRDLDDTDLGWQVSYALFCCFHRLGDHFHAQQYALETRERVDKISESVPEEKAEVFLARGLCRQAFQDPALLNYIQREPGVVALERSGGVISLFDKQNQLSDYLMSRLLTIYKRINSQHSLDRLLDDILDAAIDLTGAERGFLILHVGEGLEIKVARNIDRESIIRTRQKISYSIAETVFASGEPLLSVDAMSDDRFSEAMSIYSLKLRSILCLPLRVTGKVIGVIYMDNRFQKGAFNDTHLRIMEAFADQAAIAIRNARLFEENQVTQQELKKACQEIESLNQQLQKKLEDQSVELFETKKLIRMQRNELAFKYKYENIIGRGSRMQKIFHVLDRVTDSQMPVLIVGESGTGKELIARAIHYNGPNRANNFVSINCGALTESLLESELFGHVRGAFTGADRDKPGLFEVASGGTIFLDEVGDMSPAMQVKLLRVLQEHELRRVGGKQVIPVNARVLAATNRNLEKMIESGDFRQDLYYRLNVVKIQVPPLRERREDIPHLVDHFVEKYAEENQCGSKEMDPRAMRVLALYDWPGNIRQLETVVYNLCLFSVGERISHHDLANQEHLLPMDSLRAPAPAADSEGEMLSMAAMERTHIRRVLGQCNFNKTEAARILGIDRKTLYNKIKTYKID